MIARSMLVVALCSTAIGCLPKETTEKGPEVTFTVERNGLFLTLDETSTMMRIDSATMKYEFKFTIKTQAGEEKTGVDTTYHPVEPSGLVASFTVPGLTVDGGTYPIPPGSSLDRKFERTELVSIPGTAMGQSMLIHVEATDSNGLGSNVLDVTYALVP